MIPYGIAASSRQTAGDDLPVGGRNAEKHWLDVFAEYWLPLLVLGAGFGARLFEAWAYFLNPDEALHNLLASQTSLGLAYKAALTNAHPPLLILVLYYWRLLGQSELMLRMPSVLAGTACCGLAYLWLKDVTDRRTAFLGLLFFAFAPALIGLSAEVRQYALLLFFMSCCLYCGERAIRNDSILWMILFSLSLCGALLTHYSSFLFAFSIGVYMLVRQYPYRNRSKLFAAWVAGQIVAAALATYFLVTHVAGLRQRGMPREIADTWLRKSIFHPGENHLPVFVAAQTLRVFTFLLSHGVFGTLTLIAFLAGMILLLRRNARPADKRPTSRQLALLLGLPFLLNCIAAVAGFYPYGATRHNVFLALFGLSGASIGLAAWRPKREWAVPLIVFICLAVCNFSPAPPPLIKAKNHKRFLMQEAADSLRRSVPAGSILFSDYESGLLVGYYVCGHGVVQVFLPLQPFAKSDCGPFTAITARPQVWKFYAEDLPLQLASLSEIYGLTPGTKVWLVNAGWIEDSAPALRNQLQQLGCAAPQTFGDNILICQITLGARD